MIIQDPIESGWLIASGEAIFADEGQYPDYYAGINRRYPSPEGQESGVIHTYEEDESSYQQITGSSGDVNEVAPSFLSKQDQFSRSDSPYYANLGVFFPYIHYYPRMIDPPNSLFNSEKIPVPFKVDYSLVFSRSNSYNVYSEKEPDYSALDEDGNPLFSDEQGKPPTKFG